MPQLAFNVPPCPLTIEISEPYVDHVDWVKSLSKADVAKGMAWLHAIAGAAEPAS